MHIPIHIRHFENENLISNESAKLRKIFYNDYLKRQFASSNRGSYHKLFFCSSQNQDNSNTFPAGFWCRGGGVSSRCLSVELYYYAYSTHFVCQKSLLSARPLYMYSVGQRILIRQTTLRRSVRTPPRN